MEAAVIDEAAALMHIIDSLLFFFWLSRASSFS